MKKLIVILFFCSIYKVYSQELFHIKTNKINVYLYNYYTPQGINDIDSLKIQYNDFDHEDIGLDSSSRVFRQYDVLCDTENKLILKEILTGDIVPITVGITITDINNDTILNERLHLNDDTKEYKFVRVNCCSECREAAKNFIIEEQRKYKKVIPHYEDELKTKLPHLNTYALISNLETHKEKAINQLRHICDSIIEQFETNPKLNGETFLDSLKKYKKQIYYIGNEYNNVLDTVLTGADYEMFSLGRYADPHFTLDFDLNQLNPQPYNPMYDTYKNDDTLNIYINFMSDKDTYLYKDTAEIELNKIATYMTYNTETNIEITGHTDCTNPNTAYLNKLSRQRAEKIKTDLHSKGISKSRIRIYAKGKNEPVAPCNDKRNRRITAKYDKYFTIPEIENKITERDSLLVTRHMCLFEEPNVKSLKLNTTVSVNRKYLIMDKTKKRKQMKLGRAKLCNYWYKIRTEKGVEGWIYGFFTNKKLKSHIIKQHYIAKEGNTFESIVKYANGNKSDDDYKIDVEWLQFLNPNSAEDGQVTEGEDFYIKTFKKLKNKK